MDYSIDFRPENKEIIQNEKRSIKTEVNICKQETREFVLKNGIYLKCTVRLRHANICLLLLFLTKKLFIIAERKAAA